jgi:transposase
MKTITLEVRELILKCYDRQKETRAQVAQWFGVSLGLIKKLLQQRRRIGDLAPQHHRAGRKPKILPRHRQQFQTLLKKQPDLTLAELRTATRLNCSLPAICYVLTEMGLTYKKRLSAPANRTGRISLRPGRHGRLTV